MGKKYKISPVDYEYAVKTLDKVFKEYSDEEWWAIEDFRSDWIDFPLGYDKDHLTRGINPKDGYDYIESIEELVPPQLKEKDKEAYREELRQYLIKL